MNPTDYCIPAVITPSMAINKKIVNCINYLNSLEFTIRGVSCVNEITAFGVYTGDLSAYEIDKIVSLLESVGWKVDYSVKGCSKGVSFRLTYTPQPDGCDI